MRRWLLGGAIAVACGDPHDADLQGGSESEGEAEHEYEVLRGAHVEIRHFAHLRVCGGDLAALDAHVPVVADLLGQPDVGPFVYEWVDEAEVTQRCGRHVGGCVREGVAYGTSTATGFHELNHLVAGMIDGTTALWSEGLAVAFEPNVDEREEFHPLLMLDQSRDELSYPTAGHFFRWVWSDVGRDSTLATAGRSRNDDIDGALAAFEEEIGESLAIYGDRYLAEAPERLPSLLPRTEEPLPWTGDRWAHVFDLDCAAQHTRVGYDDALVRRAYVDVGTPGVYELAVSRGSATLYGVVGDDGSNPGANSFEPGNFRASPESVARGTLTGGRYVVSLSTDSSEPQTIAVELRPVLGAVPQPPE